MPYFRIHLYDFFIVSNENISFVFIHSPSTVTCAFGTTPRVLDTYHMGPTETGNSTRSVHNNESLATSGVIFLTFLLITMSLQVAPQIKARMMEKGSTMIGYQPLGAKVNFFRCVLSNHATQHEDIDFLLDEIVRLGRDL